MEEQRWHAKGYFSHKISFSFYFFFLYFFQLSFFWIYILNFSLLKFSPFRFLIKSSTSKFKSKTLSFQSKPFILRTTQQFHSTKTTILIQFITFAIKTRPLNLCRCVSLKWSIFTVVVTIFSQWIQLNFPKQQPRITSSCWNDIIRIFIKNQTRSVDSVLCLTRV